MKRFLSELKFDGMAPTSIMFYKDVGHSQEGAKEVTALLEAGAFDGPKPIRLMERLLTLANLDDDSIVLDFFSGSASTAHAVLKTNTDKNRHCRFIMVQLPEATTEDGTAFKSGFKTICEIGKERIRRAGDKIVGSGKWTVDTRRATIRRIWSRKWRAISNPTAQIWTCCSVACSTGACHCLCRIKESG